MIQDFLVGLDYPLTFLMSAKWRSNDIDDYVNSTQVGIPIRIGYLIPMNGFTIALDGGLDIGLTNMPET